MILSLREVEAKAAQRPPDYVKDLIDAAIHIESGLLIITDAKYLELVKKYAPLRGKNWAIKQGNEQKKQTRAKEAALAGERVVYKTNATDPKEAKLIDAANRIASGELVENLTNEEMELVYQKMKLIPSAPKYDSQTTELINKAEAASPLRDKVLTLGKGKFEAHDTVDISTEPEASVENLAELPTKVAVTQLGKINDNIS